MVERDCHRVRRGNLRSQSRRACCARCVCGVACMPSLELQAQRKSKEWRIGFLASGSSATRDLRGLSPGPARSLVSSTARNRPRRMAFRGREIRATRLDWRTELVRLDVDVIVAGTTLGVQAARQATTTIPIVMVAVPDPVGEGFAKSLSTAGRQHHRPVQYRDGGQRQARRASALRRSEAVATCGPDQSAQSERCADSGTGSGSGLRAGREGPRDRGEHRECRSRPDSTR